METDGTDDYSAIVAVHGFDPLSPEDPYTKEFSTVAQDRISKGIETLERRDDALLVLTGGEYGDRLNDYFEENDHRTVDTEVLPTESELMLNQARWMHDPEVPLTDRYDVELEKKSQDTAENIEYLQEIVEETGADELYVVTSRDHEPRAGFTAKDMLEDVQVYSVASDLSYAAPMDEEENPGVFFGEYGNQLRPIIQELDENIWGLFGEEQENIEEKAENIGEILNK